MDASLYRTVIGAEFEQLAPALRRFHSLQGRHLLQGWVESAAPASPAARVLAWCLGTPVRARSGPLRFELAAAPTAETWTRHFPGRTMRSRMSLKGGRVVEQLGPARLTFRLVRQDTGLAMRLERLQFLRIPCPRWLMPRIVAEETGSAGRLHFDVRAAMPIAGLVTHYRGYIELPEEQRR